MLIDCPDARGDSPVSSRRQNRNRGSISKCGRRGTTCAPTSRRSRPGRASFRGRGTPRTEPPGDSAPPPSPPPDRSPRASHSPSRGRRGIRGSSPRRARAAFRGPGNAGLGHLVAGLHYLPPCISRDEQLADILSYRLVRGITEHSRAGHVPGDHRVVRPESLHGN